VRHAGTLKVLLSGRLLCKPGGQGVCLGEGGGCKGRMGEKGEGEWARLRCVDQAVQEGREGGGVCG